MNHLTETQLNEALDNALSAPEQHFIEKHLSGCADCRSKMEAMRSLFQTLDELPEEALHHDLTPLVMSRLPGQRINLGWKLVLATQTGTAIGMVIILLAHILAWFQPQEWLNAAFSQLTRLEFPISYPSFTIPNFPALNFQPSSTNIIFLAISALILWSVGNATLLRGRQRVQK